MSFATTVTLPLPALLLQVKMAALARMFSGMADAGFPDVRESHGCVFGYIDAERGSRLTELAERSRLTKQAVGEAATDLERLGYLERVPDPADGRAKIIRLTERGQDAWQTTRRLLAEVEGEWAERLGEDLVAGMREAAERIVVLENAQRLTGSTASPS
jgi:DNA-binding MarR family transcriptional regulator